MLVHDKNPSNIFRLKIISGFIFLNSLMFFYLFQSGTAIYQELVQKSKIDTANLVNVLELNVERLLDKVDVSLLILIDEISGIRSLKKVDREKFSKILKLYTKNIPEIRNIQIADSEGIVLCSPILKTNLETSINDKEYFQLLKQTDKNVMVLSEPYFSEVQKEWLISAARRISSPDRSFMGILYADIPIDQFRQTISRLNIGIDTRVIFATSDLRPIVQYPLSEPEGSKRSLNLDKGGSQQKEIPYELRAHYDANRPEQTIQTGPMLKSSSRILSYKKSNKYPLLISATASKYKFYNEFWIEIQLALSFAVIFMIGTTILALFIYKRGTEQAKMMRKLSESFNRLNEAQRLAKLGSWELDIINNRLEWSDEIFRMFEVDRNQFEASYDAFLNRIHPEDREMVNEAYLDSVKNKKKYEITHRLLMSSGDVKYVVENCRTFYDPNNHRPLRSVGTVQDITERFRFEMELKRAREAAEAANVAKSNFLSNMSHEIRTPLNGVIGFSQVLSDSNLDSDQKVYVDKIIGSGESLLRIIDDILDVSRLEANKLKIENLKFSLFETLKLIKDTHAFAAKKKNLDFEIIISEDVPDEVIGDPYRLRQILNNLLSNSVKFTEIGGIKLVVKMLKKEVGSCRLLFEVIDTGIGISSDQIRNLFEPFTQADTSISRKFGGTGLGLSICRRIAELMGGEVFAHSEVGRGSVFTFASSFGLPGLGKTDEYEVKVESDGNVEKGLEVESNDEVGRKVEIESNDEVGRKFEIESNDEVGRKFEVERKFEIGKEVKDDRDNKDTEIFKSEREILKEIYSQKRLEGQTVLVVDDNEMNQEFLKAILHRAGAQVLIANDGVSCLKLFNELHQKINFILMDVQMPLMDGYEVTKKIRSTPFGRAMPIIGISARVFPDDLERGKISGMNEYLTKPLNIKALFSALDVFQKHRSGLEATSPSEISQDVEVKPHLSSSSKNS